MTTMAYNHKDKEIAVDSRTTKGGLIVSDKSIKFKSVDGVLFFFCGVVCDEDLFLDYYFNRIESKDIPDCSAFVVDSGIAYEVVINDHGCLCKYKMNENSGIGSGGDFALAAMDFGSSAKDAVKYAATKDIYTGGKVHLIKIKKV